MTARFCSFLALIALVAADAQTPQFSFFARRDIQLPSPAALAAAGVADFNGDGIMDIAAADAIGEARVMLGTGNLAYTTTFYAGPGQCESIVIADFNNDGHPDFAIGVASFSGLGVYINNGDGTFSGPTIYPAANSFGLAAADVDNDGNLDIIGQGFVMLGLGDGRFEDPAPLVRVSPRGAGLRAGVAPKVTSIIGGPVQSADLNGDGNMDVVTIGTEEEIGGVFLGNGNGTFRAPPKGSTCSFIGTAVAIADFNNDGIPDLAFSSTGEVNVCLGNGDGTFGKTITLSNGGNYPGQSIVAADLNGDGNMDIAVVDLNRGGGTTALFSPMAVFYGKGNGAFEPAQVFATIFPFDIAVGDLNGDGIPDLVVAGGEETDPLIFAFLGTPSGKLAAAKNFKVGVEAPQALAVGDFSGDGNLDLAVTGSKSNDVSILLGNGNDGFTAGGTFATGPAPAGVVTGDFNGDGKLDLAVVNSGLDNVSILLGNGDGTFQTAQNFGAGQKPIYAVVGDFNGDGRLDLAVTNSAGNNVSILLGKGDGTFGDPTNFATGSEPEFIAAGDLNGDGKLDLAIANAGDEADSVTVLFGKGDGTFEPAVTLATGGIESAGIAIADFNGDSKPDIVVANFGSATVSVFLGNGAGTFQAAITSPVGLSEFASGPWSLAAGDFNGDGKTDVAVIAFELQDVALLPGLGNGHFGPAQLFGADALPFAIASAPLRAGKPNDLVVVGEERNLVSILTNTGN
ncbi:MAG: VCBS repeat-containing protein [Bryobacteraceae bacterium]|jgi:hypothetical protein